MIPEPFRRRLRVLLAVGAAALVTVPLTGAAEPAPARAASAQAAKPGPLPVTGPDTIKIAGAKGYITYGASMRASRKACGKPKKMSTKKNKKNCWIPYVVHGKGARVSMDRTVDGDALPKGPGAWVDRTIGLWAPSVVHHRGKYYMFYAATKKGTTTKNNPRGRKCIGVATSKFARKGFTPRKRPLVCHKGGWAIDPEAFVGVRKGRPLYLTYRDDAATTGYQTAIVVARLNAKATKTLKRKTVLTSKQITWEHRDKKNRHDTYIVENPSMIWAHKRWWLFYSGNSWETKKYATGIAKCGANPLKRVCTPVPGPHRPYFGYLGKGGLKGKHKPVSGLPRNKMAPGGMSVFRATNGTMRAVWNYKTFPEQGRSHRSSLVGKLYLDHGRWRITEE